MDDWIPFVEGEYLAEQAFILAPNNRAVALEDPVIEIYLDAQGKKQLKGRGRIRNILMVELLEDDDRLDLILDLGQEFKYRLMAPVLQGGKVFAPDVKSMLNFAPVKPWEDIVAADFEAFLSQIQFLE